MLTTKEAGQLLKKSPKTIIRLIKSRQLIASRIGRAFLVKESDLEQLLKNTSNAPEVIVASPRKLKNYLKE